MGHPLPISAFFLDPGQHGEGIFGLLIGAAARARGHTLECRIVLPGKRIDGTRKAFEYDPPDLDLTRGIVVHLPAEGSVCTLFEVDLVTGWALARLAREVRDSRNTKGLASARYSREQS